MYVRSYVERVWEAPVYARSHVERVWPKGSTRALNNKASMAVYDSREWCRHTAKIRDGIMDLVKK